MAVKAALKVAVTVAICKSRRESGSETIVTCVPYGWNNTVSFWGHGGWRLGDETSASEKRVKICDAVECPLFLWLFFVVPLWKLHLVCFFILLWFKVYHTSTTSNTRNILIHTNYLRVPDEQRDNRKGGIGGTEDILLHHSFSLRRTHSFHRPAFSRRVLKS